MKVLFQSDDYGFTKGITLGILDAIENGVLTCTGLFVNMGESSVFAAKKIKDYPDTCFGIDFNIVSGHCVADPNLIPNLVDDNGMFIRSTVKYKDPRFTKDGGNEELWPYDEVMIEIKAQLEKYRELVGKDPEYLHGHSISRVAKGYVKAISDLAKESGIPYSQEIREANGVYSFIGGYNVKPFTIEAQVETSTLEYCKEHLDELVGHEICAFTGHAGYIDSDIFKWSTYSIIRCKDKEFFTSDFVKEWLKKNNAELISYRDLKK